MPRTYRQYKKQVKKLGAKKIATPGEYAVIQQRLDKVYKKPARKTMTTPRTRAIEKALKRAGVTQQEINRLRGR